MEKHPFPVLLRFTKETHEQIEAMAEKQNRSKGEVGRMLVENALSGFLVQLDPVQQQKLDKLGYEMKEGSMQNLLSYVIDKGLTAEEARDIAAAPWSHAKFGEEMNAIVDRAMVEANRRIAALEAKLASELKATAPAKKRST